MDSGWRAPSVAAWQRLEHGRWVEWGIPASSAEGFAADEMAISGIWVDLVEGGCSQSWRAASHHEDADDLVGGGDLYLLGKDEASGGPPSAATSTRRARRCAWSLARRGRV
ncbi:unnamed protein product [Prorocentrum cordatum]|uniref:Uncharacterized protein n=1 Tax=Prorocentrum cordatum TaxID=2364126 RepID=A0ABN9XKT7_9DINO|nr:unnamed protein product [Polarella glacialis]